MDYQGHNYRVERQADQQDCIPRAGRKAEMRIDAVRAIVCQRIRVVAGG